MVQLNTYQTCGGRACAGARPLLSGLGDQTVTADRTIDNDTGDAARGSPALCPSGGARTAAFEADNQNIFKPVDRVGTLR